MKLRKITVLAVAILAVACKSELLEETVNNNSSKTESLATFKGLPVHHRFHTPVSELETEHDEQTLRAIYSNEKRVLTTGVKFGAVSGTLEELPSVDLITESAKEVVNDFPYDEAKTEEEVAVMIQADFPTLTEEQIEENMPVIEEYYTQNFDYEVLYNIAHNEQVLMGKVKANNSKLARIKNSNYDSDALDRMWCILTNFQNPAYIVTNALLGFTRSVGEFSYIKAAVAIKEASESAKSLSGLKYPNLSEADTKRDAYRHLVWSALLCQHYYTVSSKVDRLRFSEAVGYANEECGVNDADSQVMDIHNNVVGRSIWDAHCTYRDFKIFKKRIIYGLNKPSLQTILDNSTWSVENNSVFIESNKIENTEKIGDRKSLILQVHPDKVVYIK